MRENFNQTLLFEHHPFVTKNNLGKEWIYIYPLLEKGMNTLWAKRKNKSVWIYTALSPYFDSTDIQHNMECKRTGQLKYASTVQHGDESPLSVLNSTESAQNQRKLQLWSDIGLSRYIRIKAVTR